MVYGFHRKGSIMFSMNIDKPSMYRLKNSTNSSNIHVFDGIGKIVWHFYILLKLLQQRQRPTLLIIPTNITLCTAIHVHSRLMFLSASIILTRHSNGCLGNTRPQCITSLTYRFVSLLCTHIGFSKCTYDIGVGGGVSM